MTEIVSMAALLHAAVQDIHAGLRDEAKRIPDAARDADLGALLARERVAADDSATRLEVAGLNTSGPANLWMKGVLDDAERDVASTMPGRLLDIALAGAVRKGKAAEVVACDTALALAGAEHREMVEVISAIRERAMSADQELLAVIIRLAKEPGSAN